MDEFGWSESEAVSRLGIIMSVGGVLMLAIYLVIPRLAKRYFFQSRNLLAWFFSISVLCFRFDERLIMLIGGIIPSIIARLCLVPIPGRDHPPLPEGNGEERLYGNASFFQLYATSSDFSTR